MHKKIHLFILAALTLWVVFFRQEVLAQESVEAVDKILAVVNDKIITSSELNEKMQQVMMNLKESNTSVPPESELRKKVLDNVILESIQLQLAKRAGITVSDVELNKAIDQIVERNHQTLSGLKASLTERNLSFEDFKKQLTQEITIQKLQGEEVAQDVKVNDIAVKELAEQLKKQTPITATQYHLNDIVVPLSDTPSAEEVNKAQAYANVLVARLKQGERFSDVALATNASGENALQGGDMGWHALVELPEVFVASVKNMKKGDISVPIQTGNGFHILKLMGIRQGEGDVLLENEEQRLKHARELLFQREFEQHLQTWLQQIRAGAYVKIY